MIAIEITDCLGGTVIEYATAVLEVTGSIPCLG